jgi:glyoxylase-like metal-dependent hydrolase (beta-lactamase superfamily II)
MSDRAALPDGLAVLERGWLSSNNVVFAQGVTAVVDTGYVAHSAQTVALVARALAGQSLRLIVNTHLHSDHCGGNAALRAAFPSSRTVIPPGQAGAVARWDEEALSYRPTGQECARFTFDGVLRPGDVLRLGLQDWEVHAAPGHDPHSVVLFERISRTLISADALWQNGFGVVFPELEGEPAFSEVAATLDLIEGLDARFVIPGHGAPFGGASGVAAALGRARSRLEGFAASPRRHAAHAMKVLIKFKLLEWQQVPWPKFVDWAERMPYMGRVHARFFVDSSFQQWLGSLTDELVAAEAIGRDAEMLYNI